MANVLSGSHATTTEVASSPLMNLPPELRSTIYHHYFGSMKTAQWLLSSLRTPRSPRSARYLAKVKTSIVALRPYLRLLHVCGKVRSEAGPIFYNQYLAGTEFVFNIDYFNAAENFTRMQAICTSAAVFTEESEIMVKLGFQIFTQVADTSLLLELADRMHQHAAWWLQRKAARKHGLAWRPMDPDAVAKLDLSTEESAFITYNLTNMPKLKYLGFEDRFRSVVPGFEMHYAHNRFRIFGPLARVDWAFFEFENVPWHLPSTVFCDEFVHEDGPEEVLDSDDEPSETSLYDLMELDSGGEDNTDMSGYESAGEFDHDHGVTCEDGDYDDNVGDTDDNNDDGAVGGNGNLFGNYHRNKHYAGSPKWQMQRSEW